MREVDRCFFSPERPYEDAPQPIGHHATISAPHMHAYALEVLEEKLEKGAKVLDVGSGSGYLAACFAVMVGSTGKVTGIDHIKGLVDDSIENVNKWDPQQIKSGHIELITGDGRQGYSKNAPYDAIHVGAAADGIPNALYEQLAPGGRMIVPVGPEGGTQFFTQVDKDEAGNISKRELMSVMYVPLTDKSKQIGRTLL